MSIPGILTPLFSTGSSAAAGYQVERSLRFNSSDSAFLSRTPAVAGNRQKWTWAGWVKRAKIGVDVSIFAISNGSGPVSRGAFYFLSNDTIRFWSNPSGSSETANFNTTAVFRDPSAWYHIVFVLDTTQSTDTERIKIYVNNERLTPSSATYMARYEDAAFNQTYSHFLGNYQGEYGNFYLADIHFIDDQALTPAAFTEVSATTGQLIPKAYAGTYTGNSFWLKFNDNSAATDTTLGKDSFLLGNNWTPSANISVTAGAGNDSLVDTPTSYGTDTGAGGEVRGNYCTWNPLAKGSSTTLSNGNLDMSSGASWQVVIATLGVTTGKWYWEQTMTTNQYSYTGICNQKFFGNINSQFPGATVNSWSYLTSSGLAKNDQGGGSEVSVTLTTMASGGGTLGFALDLDNQKLWFALNGVWMGSGSPDPATGTSPAFTNLVSGDTYFPCADVYDASATFNFGQRAFAYTNNRAGFKALCDTNLPEGTITTSGTFTGNANADGPFVYLNGVPTAMTINSNSITFGTHADKLSNGFKVRNSTSTYNIAGSNTFSVSTTGAKFKFSRAQPNP